jgi:organic radical activating enzyme
MDKKLFKELVEIRNAIISINNNTIKYKLAQFDNSSMAKDLIVDTPFRYFEAVPQNRDSKRRQNNTTSFDPHRDTLFDYPIIIKNSLKSNLDALDELNFHLTVQIPYCGMDCWHCYNDKQVCKAGFLEMKTAPKEWAAKDILESFASCRRSRQLPGHKYNILRISGGEPFLAPELIAELLELMGNSTNDDYPKALWTETNLVTWAPDSEGNSIVKVACKEAMDKLCLDVKNIFTKHRDKLIIHPCFHGLTDENIKQCTLTPGITFDDLIKGFTHLHSFLPESPLHLYPTFIGEACDPNGVENLFHELYKIDKSYPLKVAIISVDKYGPIKERFEQRRNDLKCYGKNASLKRWNKLLNVHYGLYYGQIPRPLAETVSKEFPEKVFHKEIIPKYEPQLIIIKSIARKEYHQELLTILASPPNSEIIASYDMEHVEPIVLDWYKAKSKGEESERRAIIVYGDASAREDKISYLPIRRAIIKGIETTERLIHIKMLLEDYLIPNADEQKESEKLLRCFKKSMFDYFGKSALLSSSPETRWVLLGEEALLRSWDGNNKEYFKSIGKVVKGNNFNDSELRNGWDRLLDTIKSVKDLENFRQNCIFLQLLPDKYEYSPIIHLKEGDIIRYTLRYYIPDFGNYDADPTLNPSRTIGIHSTNTQITVQGYHPRPLSKYGELDFQVICNESENEIPAQLIIESENQSCKCPALLLKFLLKKV